MHKQLYQDKYDSKDGVEFPVFHEKDSVKERSVAKTDHRIVPKTKNKSFILISIHFGENHSASFATHEVLLGKPKFPIR